jgi:DHA2 family multidrug resistance protein
MHQVIVLLIILFTAVSGLAYSLMGGIYMVSSLGGNQYLPIYTVAFFGIGNALGVPLGKPLGERLGYANTLKCALILYAFLLLYCAYSKGFIHFTFLRFLQGIASGLFYYLILKLVPSDCKNFYGKVALIIFTLAPVFGACVGGFVSYEFHWTYVFKTLFIIPLLCALMLENEQEAPSITPFDWIGYFSFSISAFCLGFVFVTAQELDWYRSNWINSAFIIGMVNLIFFILWNHFSKSPILNYKLLRHPVFCFGIINLAFLFSVYFGMIILLAIWLTFYVHYNVAWVSVIIGTMLAVGFIPLLLTTSKRFVVDARISLTIALVCLLTSAYHSSLFNSEVDFFRVAMSRVTAGIGFAFFLPAIFRLCFKVYQEDYTSDVVNFFQITRAMSMGVGSAIYMIIWQRRYIFYHERLGEGLTQFSHSTEQFFFDLSYFNIKGTYADIALEDTLQRQATALALEDVFYLMTWIIAGLLFLVVISLFFEKRYFLPEQTTPAKIT